MFFQEHVKRYPARVSTNPRVFLARLNGLGVFDSNGDQMGKVRDAIVVLRTGNLPARLTGLVVEVPPRRRIFIPMTKVTTIDSGQIIVTGTVNLRRFEQRKNETLVTAELLDRTVALQASGEPVTIIDVGVEQSRSREWFVDQLFVRRELKGFADAARRWLLIGMTSPICHYPCRINQLNSYLPPWIHCDPQMLRPCSAS